MDYQTILMSLARPTFYSERSAHARSAVDHVVIWWGLIGIPAAELERRCGMAFPGPMLVLSKSLFEHSKMCRFPFSVCSRDRPENQEGKWKEDSNWEHPGSKGDRSPAHCIYLYITYCSLLFSPQAVSDVIRTCLGPRAMLKVWEYG